MYIMSKKETLQLFESKKVRSVWDSETEKWYISIVDVIEVLTESNNPQVYWRVLKKRLADEGNETVTNCNALKMQAADGKMRFIDNKYIKNETNETIRCISSLAN